MKQLIEPRTRAVSIDTHREYRVWIVQRITKTLHHIVSNSRTVFNVAGHPQADDNRAVIHRHIHERRENQLQAFPATLTGPLPGHAANLYRE
ncbi:hypothetical protein [Paraburkholderia youngii]|uniref:hypothetical protein n=1 Tax=Paraburkholderia youngii TaxID=2782701 RepID=UPI003D193514